MAREFETLTASVPTGEPYQTYLRSIQLAAGHVGQIVAVRRALGVWR